jgi:hypothetical protein
MQPIQHGIGERRDIANSEHCRTVIGSTVTPYQSHALIDGQTLGGVTRRPSSLCNDFSSFCSISIHKNSWMLEMLENVPGFESLNNTPCTERSLKVAYSAHSLHRPFSSRQSVQ